MEWVGGAVTGIGLGLTCLTAAGVFGHRVGATGLLLSLAGSAVFW